MNEYIKRINALVSKIPVEFIDFTKPREKASLPNQAQSNFITNREQGDWAENLVMTTINEQSKNYIAVKYGKSDDTVAGEDGFKEFYETYQQELDTIGKRPDLLIFRKEDYDITFGKDISKIDHIKINDYVKRAVAGIEVRSSAFLCGQYEEVMSSRISSHIQTAMRIKEKILAEYVEDMQLPKRKSYIDILKSIDEESIFIVKFRTPSWRSSERLITLSKLFKQLNQEIASIQSIKPYLSITPKVEDIKVVYKWINEFGVPHYYFQVFFDKIYGLSFENILKIISDSKNEDETFSVSEDSKNQRKKTIKINTNVGITLSTNIDEPEHYSQKKVFCDGRLLFYVGFKGGKANLNIENIAQILGLANNGF